MSFDPNNAIVFDGGTWRPASIRTARTVLIEGSEMTIEEFKFAFPNAAKSLPRIATDTSTELQ